MHLQQQEAQIGLEKYTFCSVVLTTVPPADRVENCNGVEKIILLNSPENRTVGQVVQQTMKQLKIIPSVYQCTLLLPNYITK